MPVILYLLTIKYTQENNLLKTFYRWPCIFSLPQHVHIFHDSFANAITVLFT